MCRSSSPATVYDALMAAGAPHGIANAGYRAIESLRLEKGYRAWGADIGPDHTPLEAGLGWAVKLQAGHRRSSAARRCRAQAARRCRELLAGFTVDDPEVVLLGRETIYRDGERVGWLPAAATATRSAGRIGYGYVRDPRRRRSRPCPGRHATSSRSPASACRPRLPRSDLRCQRRQSARLS